MRASGARREYVKERDASALADSPADSRPLRSLDGGDSPRGDRRPGDGLARIDEFLQSLARAVRQFHTYPVTSPKCIEAIGECHRALGLVEQDRLAILITPRELLVDGTSASPTTQEFARRLHEAGVSTVDFDRTATRRDLARFCADLVAAHDGQVSDLAELLRDHGVDRIALGAAYRPEVLQVALTDTESTHVEVERRKRDAQPTVQRASHLYPPDKGWVRVDPGFPVAELGLTDLATLVDDPAELAGMLSRLAGDVPSGNALEQRFGDVARLFSSLDPAVAHTRFSRLAAAVLALEPSHRRRLLSSTVLPGLVDGRPEGDVLRSFPDIDLADALSLLLDVETAAPELLTSALDRLNLTADRQAAVAPLLEDRIRADAAERQDRRNESALAERTEQLIRVASGNAGMFAEFAAFDLCMDEDTAASIAGMRQTIAETDAITTQLTCITQLVALIPNPEVTERILAQAQPLLAELERDSRWLDIASALEMLQRAAEAVRAARPEVAAAVTTALEGFFVPARLNRILSMYEAGGDDRATANRIVTAAGSALAPGVSTHLRSGGGVGQGIVQLIRDHASMLGPALVGSLDHLPTPARVGVIRALGAAGRGFELPLSRQLAHDDDVIAREAIRALARVGSEEAANLLVKFLLTSRTAIPVAAEEALWHLPPELTQKCMRALLGDRTFVVARADLTSRLLDRMSRAQTPAPPDVLSALTSLRFRIWNRSLMRVGRKAKALLP